MPQSVSLEILSKKLKPFCPRDNHVMHFEAKSIHWSDGTDEHTVPSYHCDFEGCSVRYNHTDGYFTVVDTPDHPFFVEEPGTNVLQCPRHGAWLYRGKDPNTGDAWAWRCGIDGCDYVHARVGGS